MSDGTEPPRSEVPRFADGSLTSRADVLARFRQLPFAGTLDPDMLTTMHALTIGDEQNRRQPEYPAVAGAPYPAAVSGLDDDLNEVAGLRLPDITVPVGTHTGWNPRHERIGAPEQAAILVGSSLFFPADEDARIAADDPRPSIARRYASRNAYREQVDAAVRELVDRRHILADDAALVLDNCLDRYDAALNPD